MRTTVSCFHSEFMSSVGLHKTLKSQLFVSGKTESCDASWRSKLDRSGKVQKAALISRIFVWSICFLNGTDDRFVANGHICLIGLIYLFWRDVWPKTRRLQNKTNVAVDTVQSETRSGFGASPRSRGLDLTKLRSNKKQFKANGNTRGQNSSCRLRAVTEGTRECTVPWTWEFASRKNTKNKSEVSVIYCRESTTFSMVVTKFILW